MRVWVLIDEFSKRVEGAFLGNGDEISEEKLIELTARAKKEGFALQAITSDPVAELAPYIEAIEDGAIT